MASNETLRAQIGARSERLRQIGAELKTELFGIDEVIDRVIDAVRAWYVLPDIITRPVIVNLWGLTGTGKTQLTRSLAKKLGFYDRLIADFGQRPPLVAAAYALQLRDSLPLTGEDQAVDLVITESAAYCGC